MTQGRDRVKMPRVSFPTSPRFPAFLPSVEATDPDLEGPVDPDDEYLHGNQHSLMTHCSNMLWSQDLPRTLVLGGKKDLQGGKRGLSENQEVDCLSTRWLVMAAEIKQPGRK